MKALALSLYLGIGIALSLLPLASAYVRARNADSLERIGSALRERPVLTSLTLAAIVLIWPAMLTTAIMRALRKARARGPRA